MRALNPDHLRTFVEIVEAGSFTAAAGRLNLTQPAVSLQIRELEARCGVQLLERSGRNNSVTEPGRMLLMHARRILKAHDDALAAIRAQRDTGGHHVVRIGMTMTTLTYLARDLVRSFKRDHADISLHVSLSSSPGLADDIRANRLDLAIVTLPVDVTGIHVEPFRQDSVIGIVPEGSFTPQPTVATAELMARLPFVVQTLGDTQTTLALQWFRANGQMPHSYIEVRNLEACSAAVAAGLGVSIVPGVMALRPMPGLLPLPLDPPVTRQMAVLSHKDRTSAPHIELVQELLLQCRDVKTEKS